MFEEDRLIRLENFKKNKDLINASRELTKLAMRNGYSYNFNWLGFQIIQFPEDILNLQQIIFTEKPSCVIETGLAHGGSAILAASILQLVSNISESTLSLNPQVHCIELDVLPETRDAINRHPLSSMINIYEGSSIKNETYDAVFSNLREGERPLVILDLSLIHI